MPVQNKPAKRQLTMPAVNGIILSLIGLLVLITPLATEVPRSQLLMDVIAGAMLVVGGTVSILWGLARSRQHTGSFDVTGPVSQKPPHPSSRPD